jgi:hypothetical protein
VRGSRIGSLFMGVLLGGPKARVGRPETLWVDSTSLLSGHVQLWVHHKVLNPQNGSARFDEVLCTSCVTSPVMWHP